MGKNLAFVLVMIGLMSANVFAGSECPYGLTDDSYPGACGLYVDGDGDALCDHSQEVLELESSEPALSSEIENILDEGKKEYHLFPIFLFLVALYLLSAWMSRVKMISVVARRKFWNVMLLLSFVVSGVLGVFLILRINFGIGFDFPFNVLFWHVDSGISLLVLCVIHVVERWRCLW